MKNGKSLLVLLLIVSFMLVTGCSQAELGFWGTYGKIAAMNKSLIEGETYLSFNMSGKDIPAQYQKTLELLEDLSFKYEIRSSQYPEKFNLDLAYKTDRMDYQHLTNIRLVDNSLYVEVQPLISFLEEYAPGLEMDLTQAKTILQGVEYVKINVPQQEGLPTENLADLNELVEKFGNNLKSIFADYQTDLVTKNGDSYLLEINFDSLLLSIKDFAHYTLEHSDQLISAVYNNIDDLDEETLALMLNIPREQLNKEEIKTNLQQLEKNISLNKEYYTEEIEKYYQMGTMLKEHLERYDVSVELTNKSRKEIGVKEEVNMDIKNPTGLRIGLFALETANIREVDEVIVTAPKGKVLDLNLFENMK